MGRRVAPSLGLDDFDEDLEDHILEDYLENVEACSDEDDSQTEEEHGARHAQHMDLLQRFGGFEIGDEGTVVDIINLANSGDEWSDANSDGAGTSHGESVSEPEEDDDEVGIISSTHYSSIAEEEVPGISLEMRYPVYTGKPLVPSATSGEWNTSAGNRSGGRKGPKFAPGEKKRNKREGLEARRMERAISRGLDIASMNAALYNLVASGVTDVHVFHPMAAKDRQIAERLATLYGCRAGLLPGGNKRRRVIVTMTDRTCLPTGEAELEIKRLLEMDSHEKLKITGNASSIKPSTQKKMYGLDDSPRFASVSKKGSSRKYAPEGSSRKKKNTVMFVSGGTIGAEDTEEVVVSNPEEANKAEGSDEQRDFVRDKNDAAHATPPVWSKNLPVSVIEDRSGVPPPMPSLNTVPSRGAVAAEGITNSGRLLGLGMALGVGGEIFGQPGISFDNNEGVDLSLLQPKVSKSAERKLKKKKSRAGANYGEGGEEAAKSVAAVGGDYADFERHTTGIGSRLLAKWGFGGEGSGLGKEGTGIAEPIVAKMRTKKLGLGVHH